MKRKIKFKKVQAAWVRLKDRDTQIVGAWLLKLAGGKAEKIQGLDAERVVNDAKNPRSPGHKYLYGVAAEKIVHEWRLTRARELCRSITWHYVEFREIVGEAVPVEPPEGCEGPRLVDNVRGFDNYFATQSILNDATMRKAKVHEALLELASWRSKYWLYSELKLEVEWIEERLRHHGVMGARPKLAARMSRKRKRRPPPKKK